MVGIVACCILQTSTLACFQSGESQATQEQVLAEPVAPVEPLVTDPAVDTSPPLTGDNTGGFAEALARLASSPLAWVCLVLCVLLGILLWRADAIRPRSLSRGGIRDVTAHPAWAWLVAGFATLLVMSVGGGLAMAVMQLLKESAPVSGTPGAPLSTRDAAIVGSSSYAVGITLAIVLIVMLRGAMAGPEAARAAGLRATPRGALLGIVGFIAAWPLVTGLGMILLAIHEGFTSAPTPDLAHATLEKLTQSPLDAWTLLLMAGAILGAPIVEELLFRGFVQSGLLRATSRPWLSALAAAGLFGLMHVAGDTGMPWYAVLVVTALGACMGVAYERTRDLATPIVMHILFNSSNVALALMATR